MPSYLYCAFSSKLMCILDIIYSFIEIIILYNTIDTVDLFSVRFIFSFKLLTL